MKNKSYAVIGLGQFGMTVALTLAEANCDVLAIDDKDDNVQDIAEKVSYAVKADVRDPGIFGIAWSSERRCCGHRSSREYGGQYYSNDAGERTWSSFCHGEGNESSSWQDTGENRGR